MTKLIELLEKSRDYQGNHYIVGVKQELEMRTPGVCNLLFFSKRTYACKDKSRPLIIIKDFSFETSTVAKHSLINKNEVRTFQFYLSKSDGFLDFVGAVTATILGCEHRERNLLLSSHLFLILSPVKDLQRELALTKWRLS